MNIICDNHIFKVNDAIASSKTIQYAMSDSESDIIPSVPDVYKDCLEMKLLPFENVIVRLQLYKLLKINKKIIDNSDKNDLIMKNLVEMTSIESLDIELKNILKDRIRIFEFYDFLDVDKVYLDTVAMEIGRIIDEMDYDIELTPALAYSLIDNYPSLFYIDNYMKVLYRFNSQKSRTLYNKEKKYCSVSRLEKINLRKDIEEYCAYGNIDVVRYTLNILSDNYLNEVKQVGHKRVSMLEYLAYCAVKSDNLELLKLFASMGVNFSQNGELYMTLGPFYSFDILKFLLENGVNPNKLSSGRHPIDYAVNTNNIKAIEFLLDNGCVVHHQDAFESACYVGYMDIVKLLFNRGVNINLSHALYYCSSSENSYESGKFLISNGADVNFDNNYPLLKSISCNNVIFFKLLIENNANTEFDFSNILFKDYLHKNVIDFKDLVRAIFTGNKDIINKRFNNRISNYVGSLASKYINMIDILIKHNKI